MGSSGISVVTSVATSTSRGERLSLCLFHPAVTVPGEWLLVVPVGKHPVCDGVQVVPVTASAYEGWFCFVLLVLVSVGVVVLPLVYLRSFVMLISCQ